MLVIIIIIIMNLLNFHTYEKNKPYVYEVPVIIEYQGNYEDYDIIIAGNQYNKYNFQLKNLNTNEIFTFIIKEDYIWNWNIKTGCSGIVSGYKYLKDKLEFTAIGYVESNEDDDEYDDEYDDEHKNNKSYPYHYCEYNKNSKEQYLAVESYNNPSILINQFDKTKYEILDITVTNDCKNKSRLKTSSQYNLENNMIFTRMSWGEFRDEDTYNNFYKFLKTRYKDS